VLRVSLPYAGPPSYPAPLPLPVKKRPRAWWFAVGGLLMLAAVIVFGVSVARFVHHVTHTDAQFRDLGRHEVTLPPHVERGIYAVVGRPRPACAATYGSGTRIRFRHPSGRFTFDGWIAYATFDTGDGHVTFTCRGPLIVSDLRIAAVPDGGDLVRLGVVGVGIPLLLGGAGFLVVLVTGILWVTRRAPRPLPGRISPPFAPS
jgi:hypothetical protein